MFKKVALLAAMAALLVPAAAHAQGQSIVSSPVKASVQIQALCKSVSLGNIAWGPITPNTSNTNGGYYFAATNLQNDCVSGTTYQVATFDTCTLSNGNGGTIAYDVILNSNPSVNTCGSPTATVPGNAATFTAGGSGTNNVQLVGVINAANVNQNLPSGTYSDSVTAVVYF